jgi:hypothetical protein
VRQKAASNVQIDHHLKPQLLSVGSRPALTPQIGIKQRAQHVVLGGEIDFHRCPRSGLLDQIGIFQDYFKAVSST